MRLETNLANACFADIPVLADVDDDVVLFLDEALPVAAVTCSQIRPAAPTALPPPSLPPPAPLPCLMLPTTAMADRMFPECSSLLLLGLFLGVFFLLVEDGTVSLDH